jgi:hypothetical protein
MERITSQRGRIRAEQERKLLQKQLTDLKAKRNAELEKFDGMETMLLSDQLAVVEGSISDYDEAKTNPPQRSLQEVG